MERASDHEHFAQAATRSSRGGCLCATGWALAVGLAALLVLYVAMTREPGGLVPSFAGYLYMENATTERVFVSAASLSTWGGDMATTRVYELDPGEQLHPRITWGENGAEYTNRRVLITVIDADSDDRQELMLTCNDLFTEGIRITRSETGLVITMVPRPQPKP